jgi:hypothetical protein
MVVIGDVVRYAGWAMMVHVVDIAGIQSLLLLEKLDEAS